MGILNEYIECIGANIIRYRSAGMLEASLAPEAVVSCEHIRFDLINYYLESVSKVIEPWRGVG